MKLRPFLRKTVTFFSLQSLILAVPLAVYLGNYQKITGKDFYAAPIDKHALLDKPGHRRIIFIGGSNVAFGINSPYIGSKLNYTPINMGLHGGLGLKYILNEVRNSIRSGDAIVLSPEYQMIVYQRPDNPEHILRIVEQSPKSLQYIPLDYVPPLMDRGLIFAGSIMRSSFNFLEGNLKIDKIYQRQGFNQFGDMVAHYQDKPKRNLASKGLKVPLNIDPAILSNNIGLISNFSEECQRKGAKLFFSYPPLIKRLFETHVKEMKAIEASLTRTAKFTIIDQQEDVLYSENYFYDTEYHLNQIGTQKRAQHLVSKLSKYLSPVATQSSRHSAGE